MKKKKFERLFLVPQNRGIIEQKKGDNNKAIQFFLQAEKTIQQHGSGVNAKNLFYLYSQLSSLYLEQNNVVEAENYIKKGLAVTADPITFHAFSMNFDKLIILEPQDFLTTANNYLEVLIAKGAPSDSIISTADILDSIYYDIQPTLSGQLARNVLANTYHEMAEIVVEYVFENNLQNSYSNALAYYISSSKSKSLQSNEIFQANIDEEIQEQFKQLNKEKSHIEAELMKANRKKNSSSFDSLSMIRFALNTEIQEIYNRTNEKQLGQFYRKNRHALLSTIMSSQTDEYLIDGIIRDTNFYCYAVGNDHYSFHSINVSSVDTLSSNNIFTNVSYSKEYQEIIGQLSKEFSAVFPTDDAIQSIQFILDGSLLKIPMELLEYRGGSLLEQYNISYLNTFNESVNRRNTSHRANYTGFGLLYGDSVLESMAKSTELEQVYGRKPRLSALPGAIKELENTTSIISGKTFSNASCTKQNFLENAASNQVLHITNHVLLHKDEPGLSSIVFAEDEQYDLLYAQAISGLQLNNDLCILSSCNSGIGKNFTGNGLRSIGQTFFDAGSQAVVVNLWEAGDKSSNIIITKFMNNLKEGKKKSEALRLAKLDFLAQATPSQKHPKYWANLILIGNDEAITFQSRPSYIPYGLGLLAILSIGLIIYLSKKSK